MVQFGALKMYGFTQNLDDNHSLTHSKRQLGESVSKVSILMVIFLVFF